MNKAITCILDIGAIIVPDDFNARQEFNPEFLFGLEKSIEAHGQLVPVIVNKVDGKMYLVAGEQRLRAMKDGGESFVEAKVYDNLDYKEALLLSLTENLCRRQLNVLEEARGMSKMAEAGFTLEVISEKTGYSRDTVAQRLKLMTLPDEIQKMITRATFPLPVHQALVLAKLNERTSEQLELARRAAPSVGPVASEAQVREWVDELLGKKLPFENDDDNGGDGDEPEETVKTPTAADKPPRQRQLREAPEPKEPADETKTPEDQEAMDTRPEPAKVGISGKIQFESGALVIHKATMTIKLADGDDPKILSAGMIVLCGIESPVRKDLFDWLTAEATPADKKGKAKPKARKVKK